VTHARDSDEQHLHKRRACRAASAALGIDPACVVWPAARTRDTGREDTPETQQCGALSDAEWAVIAPLLPAESPQAGTMPNRDFVNEVVSAMQRGGTWTTRDKSLAEADAVRRRFGRWAHRGVFQALAVELDGLALSPERKRAFMLAARRAGMLCARHRGRAQ